jgi:hypothetical protein
MGYGASSNPALQADPYREGKSKIFCVAGQLQTDSLAIYYIIQKYLKKLLEHD